MAKKKVEEVVYDQDAFAQEQEKQQKKESKIDYNNLDMNVQIRVKSLSPWDSFFRRSDNMVDVRIPPRATTQLSRAEVITQVQNTNNLFSGVDGVGSHAPIYILDEPTRIYLGFDSEDGSIKQKTLNEDTLEELFQIKDMELFKNSIVEYLQCRFERQIILTLIDELELNDYRKIKFIENYIKNI